MEISKIVSNLFDLRPYFIEDPIVPDSVTAMAQVSEKMKLPLAVGERNMGIWEFKEYAELEELEEDLEISRSWEI